MAKRSKGRSARKKGKNNFAKPSTRWYRTIRIAFYVFLGLILVRFLLALASGTEYNTDDMLFKIFAVSFGTLVAWWYVRKRKTD